MKLNYDRKSKNPTYFIQHGYRVGNKSTTKNVYRIGKHNDLLKITDDPLAYAKQIVKEYNEEYKKNNANLEVVIDFKKKLPISNHIVATSNVINIGYLYLQQIYKELKTNESHDQYLIYSMILGNIPLLNHENINKDKVNEDDLKPIADKLCQGLKKKLAIHGYRYTTKQIIETLKNMNVIYQDIYYEAIYNQSEIAQALNEVFHLELDKKYYKIETFKKY